MRQLLPEPIEEVDPADLYPADPRPLVDGRPWLMVNMVASIDGAASVAGHSSPLSGPPDSKLFFLLRTLPDVILIGAGTVRIEGYGPARPSDATREERRARGQTPAPRLAVVSRSLDLDPSSPLFAEADLPQFVLTTEDSPPDRRAALADVAEVIVAGSGAVDFSAALTALVDHGVSLVLCEGGPELNGHLVAADVLDELHVTISPGLAGGDGPRIVNGTATPEVRPYRIGRLLEADGFLFARYLRR